MKTKITSVILLGLFICTSFKWPETLLSLKLNGWVIEEHQDKIVLIKNDSITINCCVLSPVYFDDEYDQKYKFMITIEKSSRLPTKEIKKRVSDQKAIADSLKIYSNGKHGYGVYYGFIIKRNTIDSLRVPIKSINNNSIFLEDKVEKLGFLNGYFKYENEFLEIIEVRKKIYSALKVKYKNPNWYYEYVPIKFNDTFKNN
jgi:hypothetical protein